MSELSASPSARDAPGGKLVGFLGHEATSKVLIALHAIVAFAAAFFERNDHSGDHDTYLNLGLGLWQGKYSFWYFLDPYPPDTFRTPGYPIFILLTSLAGRSVLLTLLTQAALYVGVVHLCLGLIRRLVGDSPVARSIWLLLALFNAQFFYYVHLVIPEALMMFLLTLYLAMETKEPAVTWKQNLRVGLLLGVSALVRPVSMLIPFFRVALVRIVPAARRRGAVLGVAISCLVTYALLSPYALWNRAVHGKFSFVPVEGSAPNREMGFWQHRLPNEYTGRYWHDNWMGQEVFPLVAPEEVPAYRAQYHAQWDSIDERAKPFLTADDKARLPLMNQNKQLFYTFSTGYTLKRAEFIEESYQQLVREAPGYYLVTRVYTAVRQWVTSPNLRRMRAPGVLPKIAALYPFFITFSSFALGLPFAAWMIARHRFTRVSTLPFWILGFVYWGAHIPMTIQSRYTVPLQPAALVLVACALARWLGALRSGNGAEREVTRG